VLVPAFLTSELRRAFEIGFLLFIPFLVVDLVISNLLLALGMHMLSPTTVSLPFKLLLFVLADGWQLLLRGLVESYV
jgi:type III secretion protein R